MTTTATKNPDNYYWILNQDKFMYAPSRGLCTRSAVVTQIGSETAAIVLRDRTCSNMTWMPGEPTIIADKIVTEGGELEDCPGNNLFNRYRAPKPLSAKADPAKADFWLDLGRYAFGDDLDRLLDCLAFKVQYPGRKINRGFVIGSKEHGIGKDTFLVAVKRGIGSANWASKQASGVMRAIEKDFTAPFLRKTILQVSEVHELRGERFNIYDAMKDWWAAPPNYLFVADKGVPDHPIANAVLVIMTSNHLTDGLPIPPEDRRIDYIWSLRRKSDLPLLTKIDPNVYWEDFYRRLEQGDDEHVAAFLRARDLSKFKPGAEPPKTAAWKQAVSVNRPPGDSDLLDLLERVAHDWTMKTGDLITMPPALTMSQLYRHPMCPDKLRALFSGDAKHVKAAAHRLGTAGYGTIDNPHNDRGYWTIRSKRQTVYAWQELDPTEQLEAAEALVRAEESRDLDDIAEDFTP